MLSLQRTRSRRWTSLRFLIGKFGELLYIPVHFGISAHFIRWNAILEFIFRCYQTVSGRRKIAIVWASEKFTGLFAIKFRHLNFLASLKQKADSQTSRGSKASVLRTHTSYPDNSIKTKWGELFMDVFLQKRSKEFSLLLPAQLVASPSDYHWWHSNNFRLGIGSFEPRTSRRGRDWKFARKNLKVSQHAEQIPTPLRFD